MFKMDHMTRQERRYHREYCIQECVASGLRMIEWLGLPETIHDFGYRDIQCSLCKNTFSICHRSTCPQCARDFRVDVGFFNAVRLRRSTKRNKGSRRRRVARRDVLLRKDVVARVLVSNLPSVLTSLIGDYIM